VGREGGGDGMGQPASPPPFISRGGPFTGVAERVIATRALHAQVGRRRVHSDAVDPCACSSEGDDKPGVASAQR